MDQKDLIKYALIGVGLYLIYQYIQEHGGLAYVLGQSTTPTCATGTSWSTVSASCATGAAPPASSGVTPAQVAAQILANQAATGAAHPTPTITTVSTPPTTATTPAGCPAGQIPVNGTCTPAAIGATLISQQMVAAATAAGAGTALNMDQWDYYYQMVTGSAFPIDPGSIPAGVYQGAFGAGFTNPDGSPPDRTTPTDIGTWLSIMQNQDPSLGLSGLGMFSYRYTPAWLM
jgi:hypothetical protein